MLDELSIKYDTDKGPTGHFYTRHYEQIFGPIRLSIESVCEVGIGSGASLRMWRDYFPAAIIYGVDMNAQGDFGQRIQCYEIEQTDCGRLRENLQNKRLQIIIEDASHDPAKTMQTLDCLWPVLETRGWYVIEDMVIDGFPPAIGQWHGKYSEQIQQMLLLRNRAKSCVITFIQKQ